MSDTRDSASRDQSFTSGRGRATFHGRKVLRRDCSADFSSGLEAWASFPGKFSRLRLRRRMSGANWFGNLTKSDRNLYRS